MFATSISSATQSRPEKGYCWCQEGGGRQEKADLRLERYHMPPLVDVEEAPYVVDANRHRVVEEPYGVAPRGRLGQELVVLPVCRLHSPLSL